MKTALALVQSNLSIWEDSEKVEAIRNLFAPTLTSLEFEYFMSLGKATGLNPFTKELWAVKYGSSAAQIFIGRDGYRVAAQRHRDYDYHQADAVYENDQFKIVQGEVGHSYNLRDRGKLVGAYCIVKRKGSAKPMYVYVELSEYSTGKSLWHPQTGKPATMIKKVAEAQALRACFQDLLGGTYCAEEYNPEGAKVGQALGVVGGSTSESITQTERLKQVLSMDEETGEILEEKAESNNNLPINELQLNDIKALLFQKEISNERLQRALAYYKVNAISELSEAEASRLIQQLERI